ncbi:MAG: pyridoxal phosphate-dependent aminotransferase [Bacteroidetes bacterium]|nr:pyridoxal phosphate-dependent aminotransferase [Bacteroidota bacterium]
MDFDFDKVIPRQNTNSVKWDLSADKNVLPMWVADMDFATAPAITEALAMRVSHGIFGYTITPPTFYDAIISWWQSRHAFPLQKDWLMPVPGVLPALSVIIRAFAKQGDKIIVQSPVYNHFFISIQNCGCEALCNNLVYANGNYSMDFDDLEQKAADSSVKLMLLCNPHNPVGRVWTKDELLKVKEICTRHNVLVISDEIHSDIVYDGFKHIPFASLDESATKHSITCASPSKTFNLAGIQSAYMICANEDIRKKLELILNEQDTIFLNAFSAEALIAAYRHGVEWMNELKQYLYANYIFLLDFISRELPQIKILPLQATYLVWIECKALHKTSDDIANALLQKHQLWVNSGTLYGANGEGFIRLNIATPRVLLEKGLNKLKDFVNSQ